MGRVSAGGAADGRRSCALGALAGRFFCAAAATSRHALIPRSPAVGVRLRVRLFGALGRVRDASGFPSEPFPRTQTLKPKP